MTDAELEAIATKLAAARTRLILDRPFLGALVLLSGLLVISTSRPTPEPVPEP